MDEDIEEPTEEDDTSKDDEEGGRDGQDSSQVHDGSELPDTKEEL